MLQGGWLDFMILEVFSNHNDSMINISYDFWDGISPRKPHKHIGTVWLEEV